MVRIKRRYVIFQMVTEESGKGYSPETTDIVSGISGLFARDYGDFGAGCVIPALRVLCWNPSKRIGVFRVPREWSAAFEAFLKRISFFNGIQLKFCIPHVSGTVDQAQRWLQANPGAFGEQ